MSTNPRLWSFCAERPRTGLEMGIVSLGHLSSVNLEINWRHWPWKFTGSCPRPLVYSKIQKELHLNIFVNNQMLSSCFFKKRSALSMIAHLSYSLMMAMSAVDIRKDCGLPVPKPCNRSRIVRLLLQNLLSLPRFVSFKETSTNDFYLATDWPWHFKDIPRYVAACFTNITPLETVIVRRSFRKNAAKASCGLLWPQNIPVNCFEENNCFQLTIPEE